MPNLPAAGFHDFRAPAPVAGAGFRPALPASPAFALPRIGEVIEERHERIKRDLAQAEKLRSRPSRRSRPTSRRWPRRAPRPTASPRACATSWPPRSRRSAHGRCRSGGQLTEAEARIAANKQGDGERQRDRRRYGGRHRRQAAGQGSDAGTRSSARCAARRGVGARRCSRWPSSGSRSPSSPSADPVYFKVPGWWPRRSTIAPSHPQGPGRGPAPARGSAGPARRLPRSTPGRPGGPGDHRAGAPRGRSVRARDARRAGGMLERRTRQAEEKIARAEAQAVDEVRAAASTSRWPRRRMYSARRRRAPPARR